MFKLFKKLPINKKYFSTVKDNIWHMNNIDLLHQDVKYINNYDEPFVLGEIPPPPYCIFCNKYITRNRCYSKKYINKYNSLSIVTSDNEIYCPIFGKKENKDN